MSAVRKIFFALGILSLLLCLSVGMILGNEGKKQVASNVFYIREKRESNSFSLEDIEKLKELTRIAPVLETTKRVESNFYNNDMTVIGTSEDFFYFNSMNFIEGNGFFTTHEKTGIDYAVLSESAANNLFGTSKSTGTTFFIENKPFMLIGVIKEKYLDDKENIVYIPMNNFVRHFDTQEVKSIYILGGNSIYIEQYLGTIGKNMKNFLVIDLMKYINVLSQRPLIIFFLLGLCAVVANCMKIYRILVDTITIGMEFFEKYYVREIRSFLKNPRVRKNIFSIMVNLLISVIIIYIISFDFILPNYFYFTGKVDSDFFINTFKVFKQNYYLKGNLYVLRIYNEISNSLFDIAILFGLPMVIVCMPNREKKHII